MAETINWTLEVQIGGGQKESVSQALSVEATDRLVAFTVPGGDNANPGTKTAAVQPGGAGQVQFLMISSNLYDANLTFAVDGGSAIKLDSPQVFFGVGSVALLGQTQNKFVFTNKAGLNKPATISILVGRKAAP
ncbi:MAG TPA: hypothetical protein VJA21_11075 [Verrucomicrobiae bacterium]